MRSRAPLQLAPTLIPTLALAIGLSIQIPTAQIYAQEAPEYGPRNGTLVIVGGGLRDAGILERFIELGGGAEEGRFVIVPTAGGNRDRDGNVRVYDEDQVLALWRGTFGLPNVSMLHTHDPTVADTGAMKRGHRAAGPVTPGRSARL